MNFVHAAEFFLYVYIYIMSDKNVESTQCFQDSHYVSFCCDNDAAVHLTQNATFQYTLTVKDY